METSTATTNNFDNFKSNNAFDDNRTAFNPIQRAVLEAIKVCI